ncbi:DUF3566 domain-containing protein [Blastococcus sp. TF02A-30]|uniref:DUF3566 domain-containing protein n=1 Tax=Blastococcus sp. TF02A-30 TaxID=2250580 RepID=UPI000DEAB1F5|nr:DUF3566 domain-containing protein [Blastococcus sp. TF02A-30]RBY92633.1 DUF3566 domain-containing protein [Blastococcus sp. TF02A-30]
MSDRTQGSVRTGARTGEAPATGGAAPDVAPAAGQPAAAPQTAPATGTQRVAAASAPATGSQPAAGTGEAGPAASTAGTTAPGTTGTATTASGSGASGAGASGTNPGGVLGAGKGAAAGKGAKGAGRGPRRARLQLRHIDTWSALKISLVLSIALFFIWMVAVGVLYGVLSALGVFGTLNELFGQIGSASGSDSGGEVVTPGLVFGGAAVIGAINIVLLTALCTVGTFIYNLCSDLVGGLEVTLSERD